MQQNWIARFPVFAHLFRHVLGGIVLRVALHAAIVFTSISIGPSPCARILDRFFRGRVNGGDVVAVHDLAVDAVGHRAVGEIFDRAPGAQPASNTPTDYFRR